MSGTRSPSRTAPATDRALLIVAHGSPSEPEPQEEALRALARSVAAHLPGWRVEGTTLAAEGAFGAAAARLGRPVVYPFFMSEGWFTGQALARRTAALGLEQLAPFGVSPDLPGPAAARIKARIAAQGWAPADTALLLAAHGSARSKTSAGAALAFARALGATLAPRAVTIGFVEQAPFLADAARDLGQALCLAFFALRSGHVDGDLPEAFRAAGFAGLVLPPFIEWAETPGLIAQDTLRQLARPKETTT
ncbi:MAG: cobalamin biosynthesis protein CbiX [Rhodobacteraceae bacterium]|nr:cobalamin biosynthesis protein CbiX [Paracoccaceae bacterium]